MPLHGLVNGLSIPPLAGEDTKVSKGSILTEPSTHMLNPDAIRTDFEHLLVGKCRDGTGPGTVWTKRMPSLEFLRGTKWVGPSV